jgi:hypothetical protein
VGQHLFWFEQVRAFHRFAVCSECVTYNDEIARAKGPANRDLWKMAKQAHINDVRQNCCDSGIDFCFCLKVFVSFVCFKVIMERSAYHYRIQKSITFKDSLSIVIDGSEMSRYGLPYFCQSDKSTTEGFHQIMSNASLIPLIFGSVKLDPFW